MLKWLAYLLIFGFSVPVFSQVSGYEDSLASFRNNYIQTHEIVKDASQLKFFTVDEHYRVICRFEKASNAKWFGMPTSSGQKAIQRRYGTLYFKIHDTAVKLTIYQSQSLMNTEEYRDHLFVPFTDATSGEDTYGGGRYLDLTIKDINNNQCVLDFNKAYNPYCAYTEGYSCPIPPRENHLAVAIMAGEKLSLFKKH